MFAIATMIKDASGRAKFFDGILYSLPIELRDTTRIAAYTRVDRSGWINMEFGYQAFSLQLPRGGFLTFPGLMIENEARVTKKFYGYSVQFTRQQVESLGAGLLEIANISDLAAQHDQTILVHDLRVLSDAIYNSAFEAQRLLESEEFSECWKRLENVVASQGILKMRTDALDFAGNASNITTEENIPIFKKVDKVVRCFKSRAASKGKTINLNGSSYKRIRGPAILELVPYGLIDNGLKYSPDRGRVEVAVKDIDESTVISVTSFGPEILKTEVETIFKEGVRGTAAVATALPGSGIGLHMVRKIVEEVFGGVILVSQFPTANVVEDTSYFRTVFEVRLPSFI